MRPRRPTSVSSRIAYTTTYNQDYNAAYTDAYNNVIPTVPKRRPSRLRVGSSKVTSSPLKTPSRPSDRKDSWMPSSTPLYPPPTGTGATTNSESWKAAFNAAYEAGYQQSVGQTNTQSDSEVAIEGLGAIASVNADEASSFTVNLDRLEAFKATGTQTNSSATANGSATATLSTNSYATQNNQRTAPPLCRRLRRQLIASHDRLMQKGLRPFWFKTVQGFVSFQQHDRLLEVSADHAYFLYQQRTRKTDAFVLKVVVLHASLSGFLLRAA